MAALTKNEIPAVAPSASVTHDAPSESPSLPKPVEVSTPSVLSDELSAEKEHEYREQTTTEVSPSVTPLGSHTEEPIPSLKEVEEEDGLEKTPTGASTAVATPLGTQIVAPAHSSTKIKEEEHLGQTSKKASTSSNPLVPPFTQSLKIQPSRKEEHVDKTPKGTRASTSCTTQPEIPPITKVGESSEGRTISSKERVDNFLRNFSKFTMAFRDFETISRFEKDVQEMVMKLEQDPNMDMEEMWKIEGSQLGHEGNFFITRWCYSLLHRAVWMEDKAMVEKSLHTIDGQSTMYTKECSPLHVAVFLGNSNIVRLLMRKRDQCKDSRFTVLQMAVYGGNALIVKQLLEAGEHVHINDKAGFMNTALHSVVETGAVDILKILKDVKELRWNERDLQGDTPLHWVGYCGKIDILKGMKYVKELRWNEINDRGNTPLHVAAENGRFGIVKEMVQMEDVTNLRWDIKNPYGETALQVVARVGGFNSLKETMDMVKPNWNWNDKNSHGDTLLHLVVKMGSIDYLKEMKNIEEVNWNDEDKEGRTAVEIAHDAGDRAIEKVLMEIEPVNRYIDSLFKDRQVFVDAANAILVGAALIASVTFASWLQPPLGFDDVDAHVHVEHNRGLQAFWVCNAFSFYFAMATVVSGAQSVLPRRSFFIRVIVKRIRSNLFWTSILLTISIMFAVITFSIAGNIVLKKLRVTMIVPSVVGGGVCLVSLTFLIKSIYEEWKNMRKGTQR